MVAAKCFSSAIIVNPVTTEYPKTNRDKSNQQIEDLIWWY
jgi:hypothetical protein